MSRSTRAWAAAGLVSFALVALLAWRSMTRELSVERAEHTPAGDVHVATDGGAPHVPQSEVHVLNPLVPPIPTAVPGSVTVGTGTGSDAGKTVVRWELGFPRGVWSLRFVLGSPNVELRFLDLSRALSADCHALSAFTEHGPAPFPNAVFDADARTATLDDVPLEVVEALTRARELTLIACDTRFTLDDTQQRVLIDFYVQSAGAVLDAVSAGADAGDASRGDGQPAH